MSIKPEETDLVGNWLVLEGRASGDATERRIGELILNHLKKLADSPESGGWEVIYRDPVDGRYWELTFPQGEMHGGGPKRLTNLSANAAIAKYKLGAT